MSSLRASRLLDLEDELRRWGLLVEPHLPQPADLPTRPTGLFEELLQSRPEPLHVDALEHKERYDVATARLLEELVGSGRSPTSVERALLDRATFDFATSPRRDAPPPPAPRSRPAPQEEGEEEEETIPLEAMPRFWWR